MRLPHRLQGQKVKSQGGAGAYRGGDLAAQLVEVCHNLTAVCCRLFKDHLVDLPYSSMCYCFVIKI